MREILFRGLHRRKGEYVRLDGKPVESMWVYGGYFQYSEKRGMICQTEPEIDKFPVYAETVGQYTGLNDKNGTKIFEGDILQCNNNPKDIVKVVFGKFSVIDMETESAVDEVIGWHYEVIPNTPLSKTRPFCLPMPLTNYYINRCDVKVIGNIHD